jgi:hypothetical protein
MIKDSSDREVPISSLPPPNVGRQIHTDTESVFKHHGGKVLIRTKEAMARGTDFFSKPLAILTGSAIYAPPFIGTFGLLTMTTFTTIHSIQPGNVLDKILVAIDRYQETRGIAFLMEDIVTGSSMGSIASVYVMQPVAVAASIGLLGPAFLANGLKEEEAKSERFSNILEEYNKFFFEGAYTHQGESDLIS